MNVFSFLLRILFCLYSLLLIFVSGQGNRVLTILFGIIWKKNLSNLRRNIYIYILSYTFIADLCRYWRFFKEKNVPYTSFFHDCKVLYFSTGKIMILFIHLYFDAAFSRMLCFQFYLEVEINFLHVRNLYDWMHLFCYYRHIILLLTNVWTGTTKTLHEML